MKSIDPKFRQQLANLISSMGFELYGCELLPQGRQAIFRIYIDSKNGVTIDDCSAVSYQVSALMDVEDPIAGKYTLEVSSPGIDRALFELEHFRAHIGYHVKLRLVTAVNQRKQYKGTVTRIEGENIYLLVDNLKQEVVIPFSMIEKANLIGEVGFQNA